MERMEQVKELLNKIPKKDFILYGVVLVVGGFILLQIAKPTRSLPQGDRFDVDAVLKPSVENARGFEKQADLFYQQEKKRLVSSWANYFRIQAIADVQDPGNPDCYQKSVDICLDSYETNRVGAIGGLGDGQLNNAIGEGDLAEITLYTIQLEGIRLARYNPPSVPVSPQPWVTSAITLNSQRLRQMLAGITDNGKAEACTAALMIEGNCQ